MCRVTLPDRFETLVPGQRQLATRLMARADSSAVDGYDGHRWLKHLLDSADTLAEQCTEPDAVRLAVWFARADAETTTKELTALELEPATRDQALRLQPIARAAVQREAAALPADDPDAAAVHDACLSWLGSSDEAVTAYRQVLRADSDLGPAEYARQRVTAIDRLLGSEVFARQAMRERYGVAARAALGRERRDLRRFLHPAWLDLGVPLLLGLAAGTLVAAARLLTGAQDTLRDSDLTDRGTGRLVVLAVLVVLVPLGLTGLTRHRRVEPIAVAAGLGLCGAAITADAYSERPQPNWELSAGPRMYFVMTAGTVVVVAAVVLTAAVLLNRRAAPAGRLGKVAPALVGAVPAVCAIVLIPIVATGWVRDRVDTANTVATTATEAPAERPSRLDGTLRWHSAAKSEATSQAGRPGSTAGGLAVGTESGLRMVDPATGSVRWSYERYDGERVDIKDPVTASADGRTVAIGLTGRLDRTSKSGDVSYETRDRGFAPPAVVVLDAVTGRIRFTLPWEVGSHVIAVGDDWIVVYTDSQWRRYDGDGGLSWAIDAPRDHSTVVAGSLLVTVDRTTDVGAAYDLETGQHKWTAPVPEEYVVDPERKLLIGVLARSEFSDERGELLVRATKLTDGSKAWEARVTGANYSPGPWHCERLGADRDGVTLGWCPLLPGDRRVAELVKLAPENGRTMFRRSFAEQPVVDAIGWDRVITGEKVITRPDGSTWLASGGDDGCKLTRLPRTGAPRVLTVDAGRSCFAPSWLESHGTLLLDRGTEDGHRLIALN